MPGGMQLPTTITLPLNLGGTTTFYNHPSSYRDYGTDCDAFATVFGAVVRNHLQTNTTGVPPWPP